MPVESRGKEVVEKATGKVIGRSKSPEMAKRAARVRNAIHFSTWRPTRKAPARSVSY